MKYEHKKIEKKWQNVWAKNKIYTTPDSAPGKDNFYLLVEFPYPSGNLHVGHWYAFAVPDILARFHRMSGKNVLYPIGFDAFGLPAENAAIKNKLNPRTWTESNIAYMKKQIESMGTSFDWSREVVTCDPAYYKWTQWLFLQLYEKGLVYQKETAVNWCPNDKTVLANEQVVDGKCERCGAEVEQRQMLQWNIKITDYADRLIDDLAPLDWPEQIKESQRNWIGRSEGAEIDFRLDTDKNVKRFVLLHGKHGYPKDMEWLRSQLEKRGYEVQVPQLPNTEEPHDDEQAAYALDNCTFDENTAIVGYSMGGIVAMRLLEQGVRVQRVTLVATPFSGKFLDGKSRESVAEACRKGFDFEAIKKQAKVFIVLSDETDKVVPLADGEDLTAGLSAMYIRGRGTVPHFGGEKEFDILMAATPTIRVFTTRPDTLFGATYLVLAPEHAMVEQLRPQIQNWEEVAAYVKKTEKMSDMDRQTTKEKTGVHLEGVEAVNPANGEKIPVYIADYVLGHYGTGAIMAVPAHDERDYEFAKKFSLPIKEVIEPLVIGTHGPDAVRQDLPFKERNSIIALVKHWSEEKYLCLAWKASPWKGFVVGGIENGETPVAAGIREIIEETGYQNPKFVRQLGGTIHDKFYHMIKQVNTFAHFTPLLFQLEDGERLEIEQEEKDLHDVMWIDGDKVSDFVNSRDVVIAWLRVEGAQVYTGEGLLTNSDELTGLTSAEGKKNITERYGRRKTTYKLRDWIVSRQRYWGVPIPIIHCEKCGAVPVPEGQLPVELPKVEDYLPEGSGKSPLAKVKAFVDAPCPRCGGEAKRETDTLDTFVDSSWYFLRYTDPLNAKAFASTIKLDDWMPVDLYSGGAEHTTMHLLYSRFWHKALFDIGLVGEAEPYIRRMNRSIILGPDGQKMSKSHGNVIDPDEVVERLGADTVRMYLAFVGPYNEVSSFPWNPDGVVGVRRFLERVWRLQEKVAKTESEQLSPAMHKAIRKVGEDIAAQKFNTAISQLMILLNEIEKRESVFANEWGTFLQLLAPFAPHMTEELWMSAGNTESVHVQTWPQYDDKYLVDVEVTYAIQIDGKTRGEVRVAAAADKETVEAAARAAVISRLEGRTIVRAIVVPNRLVNFVLEA